MADAKNPIPSTEPGDSDDVELALETAQRLYRTGDHVEALKWLRRGASAAEEAGDDMRQLHLARAAADLAATISSNPQVVTSAPSVPPAKSTLPTPTPSRLPQPPSKQPPPSPSVKASVVPGPASSAKMPAASASSGTPQPPSASGGPPPLPGKSRPAPPSATPSPARASESQPPPPRVSDSVAPGAAKATASIKPKPAELAGSPAPAAIPSVAPVKPAVSVTPTVSAAKPDKPLGASSGFVDMGVAARGSVRVSVRMSARDEGLYIVRPLPQGQKVPPGAREAQLVFDQDA